MPTGMMIGDENRSVTPGKSQRSVDRFIPSRSALDLDIAHYNLVKENANANDLDLANEVQSPSKVRPSAAVLRRRVRVPLSPRDLACTPLALSETRLTSAPARSRIAGGIQEAAGVELSAGRRREQRRENPRVQVQGASPRARVAPPRSSRKRPTEANADDDVPSTLVAPETDSNSPGGVASAPLLLRAN